MCWCMQGEVQAMHELGEWLAEHDDDECYQWYERAATRGHLNSCYMVCCRQCVLAT